MRIYYTILYYENTILFLYHSNLEYLAIDLYKGLNHHSPVFMEEAFPLNYNLVYSTQNRRTFSSRRFRTVKYGTDSLAFLDPKIWERVSNDIKNLDSLAAFRSAKMEPN